MKKIVQIQFVGAIVEVMFGSGIGNTTHLAINHLQQRKKGRKTSKRRLYLY